MQGGTLSSNNVISYTEIRANYTSGGIAGYLGGGATASGNNILQSLAVYIRAGIQPAGGIAGELDSGTVRENRAYINEVEAGTYRGILIGEAKGSNTIENNYYNLGAMGFTYLGEKIYVIGYDSTTGTGSDEGGTKHNTETLEEIEQNPIPSTPSTPDNSDTQVSQRGRGIIIAMKCAIILYEVRSF